jgi:hypothetical protein
MSDRILLDTTDSSYYTINSQAADPLKASIVSISQDTLDIDSRCKTVAKVSLFVTVGVLSAGAKVPFIPISLKFGDLAGKWVGADGGKVLGILSAYGNSTGFFILEFWAGKAIINDALSSRRTESCVQCKQFVILPVAVALALVSQLPSALAGVQYNNKDYRYVAGSVLLVTGSILPTRSLQLAANDACMISFRKKTQSIMEVKKQELLDLISENHQLYLNMPKNDKLALIGQINEIQAKNTEDAIYEYLSILLSVPDDNAIDTHRALCRNTTLKCMGLATGTILTGLFHYALGEFTHDKSKEYILDNEISAITFAALAVSVNFYLLGSSIIRTAQRVFITTGNLLCGSYNPSIADQINPGLSFSLKLVGLVTDVFALGPTLVIWPEFYKDSEVKKYLFTISISISLFLILFTSTLDIIDDIVEGSSRNDSKAIVELDRAYQKLMLVISRSALIDFVAFHANLPEEFKNQFFSRLEETGERLLEAAEDV